MQDYLLLLSLWLTVSLIFICSVSISIYFNMHHFFHPFNEHVVLFMLRRSLIFDSPIYYQDLHSQSTLGF